MEDTDRDIDLGLMRRTAEGDQRAFQTLLDRHWLPLVVYATSIVMSQDVAKDVVQEAFIKVWQRREKWEPTSSVSAYLYRITRNQALNQKRGLRLRKEREHDASTDPSAVSPEPPQPLFDEHIRKEVERAIMALPERRREVFVLSRFHGLTHAEIAETMDISAQTVANQMSSALAELRASLSHLSKQD